MRRLISPGTIVCFSLVVAFFAGGCRSVEPPASAPAFSPAAQADRGADGSILASFEGQEISLHHFETQYARDVGGWDAARADAPEAYASFLSDYVDHRVKVKAAREAGMDRDPSLRAQMQRFRRQQARSQLRTDSVLTPIMRTLHKQRRASGSSMSFAEARDDLRRTALRLPGTRAAERALLARLQDRLARVDITALRRGLAIDRLDRLARPYLHAPDQPHTPVVIVQDSAYTLEAIAAFWQAAPDLRHASAGEVVDAFTRRAVLDHVAQRLEHTDPAFRHQLQAYWENLLVVQFMQDSVWTPARQDTAGQLAFFEMHRDRYRASHDASDSSRPAVRFAPTSDGVTFGFVPVLASVRPDAVLVSGEGSHARRSAVLPDDRAATALFPRSSDRRAGESRTAARHTPQVRFAGVRSAVVRDYQAYRERAFMQRLRKRYQVRLFPDRLYAAFRQASAYPTAALVPPR